MLVTTILQITLCPPQIMLRSPPTLGRPQATLRNRRSSNLIRTSIRSCSTRSAPSFRIREVREVRLRESLTLILRSPGRKQARHAGGSTGIDRTCSAPLPIIELLPSASSYAELDSAQSSWQGFHDIISVLYLTFIPLPPAPTPRSRSASVRSRDRSTSGRSTPFSGTMTPVAVDAISPSEKSNVDQLVKEKPDTDIAAESAQPDAEDKQPTAEGRRDVAFDLGAPAVDRDTPAWIALKRCAEVVSVCRVRDAMGSGMEPMMGMLKCVWSTSPSRRSAMLMTESCNGCFTRQTQTCRASPRQSLRSRLSHSLRSRGYCVCSRMI